MRKTDQESKFQKFSLKVEFAEMKTLQKELGETSVTYRWVHEKSAVQDVFANQNDRVGVE